MKKLLLSFTFLSFFLANLQAIERDDQDANEQNYEKSKETEATKSSQRNNLNLFGIAMPSEVLERIFDYANYQLAQKTIHQISEIIRENKIELENIMRMRQFDNIAFKEIQRLIKEAPSNAYTRIALFIALQRIFTKYEKLHFFSVMLINEQLTQNQKVILAFLAMQAESFIYTIKKSRGHYKKTTSEDFMNKALGFEYPKCEIIIKFLFKNGVMLTKKAIGRLIQTQDEDNNGRIQLIRWALKNGVEFDKSLDSYQMTPLEYCKKKLECCWLDERWTRPSCSKRYPVEIGIVTFGGFSIDHPASLELIKYNVEFYKELIELLEHYEAKDFELNLNEFHGSCEPTQEELPF